MGDNAVTAFVLNPLAVGTTAATAYPQYQAYEAAKEQKKAARAQVEAEKVRQRQADIQAYRERIKAVRQARAERGAVLQAAQAQGVTGSSGAVGAASSIASQLGANLSFLDTTQALSRQASIFEQAAVSHKSAAAMALAKGKAAQSIFDTATKFYTGK